MPYKQFRMTLSKEQQSKALRGLPIKVSKENLGKGSTVVLHPSNFDKCNKAKSGVVLHLSPGEIMATAELHGLMPGEMELTGAGFLSDIWSGVKKVGSFLKDSGIGSAVLDVAEKVGSNVVGPEIASAARGLARGITGIGAMPTAPKKMKPRIKRSLMASGLYL